MIDSDLMPAGFLGSIGWYNSKKERSDTIDYFVEECGIDRRDFRLFELNKMRREDYSYGTLYCLCLVH